MNLWSTAGFCSSVGLHMISLVRASGEMFRRRVCDAFLGHALHEKGLQRQIVDGTLVSSQEERALLVPLINRA